MSLANDDATNEAEHVRRSPSEKTRRHAKLNRAVTRSLPKSTPPPGWMVNSVELSPTPSMSKLVRVKPARNSANRTAAGEWRALNLGPPVNE